MAASAGGIYSETLQSIVDAKLAELQRKRSTFEDSKAQLLRGADNELIETEKLRVLVDGVKNLFGIRSSGGRLVQGSSKYHELEQKLANLERFLAQPRYDPSVSGEMLGEWESDLHSQLEVQTARFEYASLYAQLVTEWLAAEKKMVVKQEPDHDLDMSEFEEVESKAMMESRALWAEDVFQPAETDVAAIQSFLKQIFSDSAKEGKPISRAFQALKLKFTAFQNEMSQPDQFTESVLRWVIEGLLKTDLLSEEKRNVLRDFLSMSIILNEIADVLNLRLTSLDTWSWGDRVPLEQKRKIQGQITIVMHEDLLQAIFLQYIGIKWSVFIRSAFLEYINTSGVWRHHSEDIPLEDLKRREYFLGRQDTNDSLQAKRHGFWRSSYFMSQLPRSEIEKNDMNEGEVEADFGAFGQPQNLQNLRMMQQHAVQQNHAVQQPGGSGAALFASAPQAPAAPMAPRAASGGLFGGPPRTLQSHQSDLMQLQQQNNKRKAMARSYAPNEENMEDYDGIKTPRNVTEAKQVLLHLLSSEILINTHLYGNLTAFRAQFERWNPLLPHSTVLTVLHHLGVSPQWLKFFKTFLEAPLSFQDEEAVHHRKRGVPGSHAMSDMLGETVLFCLDLKVNRATAGGRLWRVHDDCYFWSADHDSTTTAWQAIEEYSTIMGLTLDTRKSGSVRVGPQAVGQTGDGLPSGDIRWGFLRLDSLSGRFEIDQAMIDRHATDLHRQLKAKEGSIFSWIEAYNAYADTFFTTNFGKPANCFGQQHIDGVLSTLERVQRKLFDTTTGSSSVVAYLKQSLASRFKIQNIPEGYVFFPSALGGLELRNPFVGLLQLRDNVSKDPEAAMKRFTEHEKEKYRLARQAFEKGHISKHNRTYHDYVPKDKDVFFSFKEYIRYREEFSTYEPSHHDVAGQTLSGTFKNLLERPNEEDICVSTELMSALNLMDTGGIISQEGKCGINGNWYGMEPYWKWILGVYGPGILRKFGGLNIVDNGVLPIGMVSLLRSQSVKWTG